MYMRGANDTDNVYGANGSLF